MSYQLFIVQGNLCRDVILKDVGDTKVARFTIATSRKKKDASGQYVNAADFWDIEVWGNQAISCNEYLKKGSAALAQGILVPQEWNDQATGMTKQKYVMKADKITFLGSKEEEKSEAPMPFGKENMHMKSATPEGQGEINFDEINLPF